MSEAAPAEYPRPFHRYYRPAPGSPVTEYTGVFDMMDRLEAGKKYRLVNSTGGNFNRNEETLLRGDFHTYLGEFVPLIRSNPYYSVFVLLFEKNPGDQYTFDRTYRMSTDHTYPDAIHYIFTIADRESHERYRIPYTPSVIPEFESYDMQLVKQKFKTPINRTTDPRLLTYRYANKTHPPTNNSSLMKNIESSKLFGVANNPNFRFNKYKPLGNNASMENIYKAVNDYWQGGPVVEGVGTATSSNKKGRKNRKNRKNPKNYNSRKNRKNRKSRRN